MLRYSGRQGSNSHGGGCIQDVLIHLAQVISWKIHPTCDGVCMASEADLADHNRVTQSHRMSMICPTLKTL